MLYLRTDENNCGYFGHFQCENYHVKLVTYFTYHNKICLVVGHCNKATHLQYVYSRLSSTEIISDVLIVQNILQVQNTAIALSHRKIS